MIALLALALAVGGRQEGTELLETLAEEYAALGFHIRLDEVELDEMEGEWGEELLESVARRLELQLELWAPKNFLEGICLLRGALGMPTVGCCDEAKSRLVELLALVQPAFYEFRTKRIVVVRNSPALNPLTREELSRAPLGQLFMPKALIDEKQLLAHELAHVWQFQQRPELGARNEQGWTTDQGLILNTLLEGEADLITVALEYVRRSDDLAESDQEQVHRRIGELLFERSEQSIYRIGAGYLHDRPRTGGWDEVARAFEEPPRTSEELLHPGQGPSGEVSVDLPAWPAAIEERMIVYEDVLGELGIRALFDLGISVRIKGSSYPDPEDAEVVAAGWNGDRVSIARRKGRVAIMWRTVWDRESDVEEFRDLLLTHSTDGAFHADGRVLDWVWCENPDVRRVLQGRLRRHPHPLKAAPEDR